MFFEDNIDNAKYCGHLYGLGTTFIVNGNNYHDNGDTNSSWCGFNVDPCDITVIPDIQPQLPDLWRNNFRTMHTTTEGEEEDYNN